VDFLGSVTSRRELRVRIEGITDGAAWQVECRMRRMSDPGRADEATELFALVRRRYGARLTDEQLESVRRGVEALVEQAAVLRAARVGNADEPVQRFVPFRRDE
jgi:hypothetical protein